ncbi:PD-(D/E)XK nuclease family protein [Tessaracoccus sp. HDW20]|nr:PD-(D/E)XK nuclease family protein [Tessaracoccus coleopterorum]
MHHGLHEKQISNVFRWLLDSGGTHRMGDTFTRIFMDEVNRAKPSEDPFPLDGYWVRQEVNTSDPTDPEDIADLVLESRTSVVVIENFVTSDGHGHDYDRYLAYSQRKGGRGVVVLLCRDEDRSLQTNGWQHACVVTYATLITRLREELASDGRWGRDNPEAYTFIEQLYRKFVRGRGPVQDGKCWISWWRCARRARRAGTRYRARLSQPSSSPATSPSRLANALARGESCCSESGRKSGISALTYSHPS